jgi:hypothetical protein
VQAIVVGVSRSSSSSFKLIARTSISRLAPGFIWVYCVMFPSGIHGLTMQNGNRDSETSIMGSMLGWEMDLRPRRKVLYEARSVRL